MKKMITYLFVIELLLNSCGSNDKLKEVPYSAFRNTVRESFSENMKDINDRIDERVDSVGKGYNSITGLTGERCLDNEESKFVFEPSANVAYEENLNSEQLLNKLGIGLNANIPIQASGVPITLSPEMRYSIESSSTSLAKTSNLTIEIVKGYNTISKKEQELSYKIKNDYYKSLNDKSSHFFNTCGDEIVVKQKLKAQLLITAKFTFSDSKTKSDFEAAMGASMPIPFNIGRKNISRSMKKFKNTDNNQTIKENLNKNEQYSESPVNEIMDSLKENINTNNENSSPGMSPELKVKFNKLTNKVLKNISISIKAIQIGGDPSRVPILLSSMCKLDEPGACDTLFSTIQNYASTDFPEQLKDSLTSNDGNNNKKFYLADIEKSLYSNFTIIDSNGNNISKEIINYTDNSIEFTVFKLNVRKDLRTSFQNYLKSHDIQNSSSFKRLANDEINLVKKTQDLSENNLYSLYRFINKCFLNIKTCQNNYSSKKKLFYIEYDKSFDNIRPWTFVSSTQVKWKPVSYFIFILTSDRISPDFFPPENLKGFSSFIIKYIDQNGNKITSEKYRDIDLSTIFFRCSSWFWDSTGNIWISEVLPNESHPITENHIKSCGKNKIFTSTKNEKLSNLGVFYIEIWAE